ncbi:MAG: AraC family transcriptional regulator [Candidatus Merdivicinus sp.]|jgi:AraC-like DNA-binding protein
MLIYHAADLLDPAENITIQHNQTDLPEPIHTHDFIELVYIAEGYGVQQVGNREYQVQRGSLLFLNCGELHAFVPKGTLEYYNILLKPEFMGLELVEQTDAFSLLSLTAFEEFRGADCDQTAFCSFEGESLRDVESMVHLMNREFCAKLPGYRTILRGCLSTLLAQLFRRMAIPEIAPDRRKSLPPEILAYIEEHCCEHLTLSELASRCFYHPSYFSRIFKEAVGISLTEFIGQKRMKRAAELLTGTQLSIEEIACTAGYADKGQFYRQFKLFSGMTPRSYRESHSLESKG